MRTINAVSLIYLCLILQAFSMSSQLLLLAELDFESLRLGEILFFHFVFSFTIGLIGLMIKVNMKRSNSTEPYSHKVQNLDHLAFFLNVLILFFGSPLVIFAIITSWLSAFSKPGRDSKSEAGNGELALALALVSLVVLFLGLPVLKGVAKFVLGMFILSYMKVTSFTDSEMRSAVNHIKDRYILTTSSLVIEQLVLKDFSKKKAA